MEGYTNVIGSSYDFDDLDIEGRVVDEWHADDEEKYSSKKEPPKKLDEKAILSERVKLDNGQQADVFAVVRKKDGTWYTCRMCSDTVVGLANLRQHAESTKHRSNLNRPMHSCAKFAKLDPKENLALEPGEPVPPGLEEAIFKSALIQPKLDAYKAPLIGLEFMVELTDATLDETEYYYCLLCEKTGSDRNIIIHFTSIFHYMKYLSMYFPTVARKLHSLPNKTGLRKAFGLLVTEIVKDIEDKYGRLKPMIVKYDEFHFQPNRKNELAKAAYEGPHFREIDGGLFDEKATPENIERNNREIIAAPPAYMKEPVKKLDDSKEGSGIAFNKSNRINVDKKQLRSREEGGRNSSPEVEIVSVTHRSKSPGKKRMRSRSLSSISSLSSASSHGKTRSRYRSNSRHRSRASFRKNWSRSRSRSPGYRQRRYDRRSSPHGHRYSPGRRSRDRSPHSYSRTHRSRRDSRGHTPEPWRIRVDRYGRQIRELYDSKSDRYRREITPEGRGSPKDDRVISSEEKVRWTQFREELKEVETTKLEKLKYHEKNPEKHPQYPEEWKAFWNRRYNELQRSGIDPSKHDFKPEWIAFWTKRMKELYEEDLGKAKDELKKKFDLPEDPGANSSMPWKYHQRKRKNTSPGLVDISPPTPEKKDVIADIKTTWKAFTGSDIKDTPKRPLSPWEDDVPSHRRKHSPKSNASTPPPNADEKLLEDMPQRKSRTSALIFVLRKFTVLEQQLGSLAPKTFELMSQSLALEKIKEEASLDLLLEEENNVYLETVREKLIALLCAGVVPRNCVNTARSAIKNTDIALYLAAKKQRSLPVATVRAVMGGLAPPTQSNFGVVNSFHPLGLQPVKSEPLIVPGVGQVDKVSIAQQIAAALVEQGKTNVTEAELGQLINAVVGMAEASANSSQPMTTAYFLQQLQSMQNPTPAVPAAPVLPGVSNPKPAAPLFQEAPIQTNIPKPATNVLERPPSPAFGALKLLQSAYNEPSKVDQDSPKPKPDVAEPAPSDSFISDNELASTLSVFNKMTKEDQPSFVSRLKTTNIAMYKRLCTFIPSSVVAAADNLSPTPAVNANAVKRPPINIPISKNKSEQKIKPHSGRLSPFSQRSGGVNPTIGEKVVIDDDDDDDKNDVQVVSVTPQTKLNSGGNMDNSKSKEKDSDDYDDDDDDDYSFEDVYKAAQEKLKQQQKLKDEDDKSNLSNASKEVNKPEDKSNDNSHQDMSQSNPWGNLSSPPLFNTEGNQLQSNKMNDGKLDLLKGTSQDSYRAQQSLYSDAKKYNEIPPGLSARPDAFEGSNQASYYHGSKPERPAQIDPYSNSGQPPYGGSFIPTYTNKEQYSSSSQASQEYYNKKDHFPSEAYTSTKESYDNSSRNPYSSNRNSFNASSYENPSFAGNGRYGNQPVPGNSSYGSTYSNNQYGYSKPSQFGGSFPQGPYSQTSNSSNYPPPPPHPSSYPNQRYPPY